jgi:MoxR-like ATPase
MPVDIDQVTQNVRQENEKFKKAKQEMSKVIVGQEEMIDCLFIALLADGHILLEGLPGLAKTLAMTTLASVMRGDYKRVQFTPDLLPADLVGTSIYNPKDGSFTIRKGPVFTQILLADEINRAPAKVQSALLEVMQERQVTIAGETFAAPTPYLVIATQNPIEQEGTYPLPEAQIDRFMLKVRIGYPTREQEKEVLKRMATLGEKPKAQGVLTGEDILNARKIVNEIHIDDKIVDYILSIIGATRDPKKYGVDAENLIMYGASPRASIAFIMAAKASAFLAGRGYVTPDDIKNIAHDVLRHRIRRSYEAEAEEINADDIITQILNTIPVP